MATVLEKHCPMRAAYFATHLMWVKLPISFLIWSADRKGRGEKHQADWSLSWEVENARKWNVRPPTVMPSFMSFRILQTACAESLPFSDHITLSRVLRIGI